MTNFRQGLNEDGMSLLLRQNTIQCAQVSIFREQSYRISD